MPAVPAGITPGRITLRGRGPWLPPWLRYAGTGAGTRSMPACGGRRSACARQEHGAAAGKEEEETAVPLGLRGRGCSVTASRQGLARFDGISRRKPARGEAATVLVASSGAAAARAPPGAGCCPPPVWCKGAPGRPAAVFAGAGEPRLWCRVRSGVPHPAGPCKVPAHREAQLSPRPC